MPKGKNYSLKNPPASKVIKGLNSKGKNKKKNMSKMKNHNNSKKY
jgi:hypothetical protein